MQSFNGRGFLFLQVLASVLLLALVATPAFSQASSTGTISGLVTDQQNAAVAGAEVTIVDTTTNIATKKTTNESGRYTFVEVPPSTYNITFAKAGFSTRRAAGQQIDVGQVLTMNAVLEVGATSSTVEVTAAVGAELQTMSATVGQTISGDDLMYLPNMGREASTLAIYQPGVSPEGSVAGAMYDQNTFQLDGGNNSNDMDGSMNVYTPSYASNGAPTGVMPTPIESIEEFKVATAGQTADFNGSSGSQVQMVTKRGSNSFHGSVYEYYYASDVGAANTWDNNWQGIPLPITHNNRYGAAIGGPLVPKKILGGKWYFFVNYEGFRFGQSALITKLVPSDLLRAGVVQISTGSGEQAYNLNPTPVTVNGVTYQPATCPAGSCDPRGIGLNSLVSQIWNKYEPQPNLTSAGDHYNTLGFQGVVQTPTKSDNEVARIDHDFSDKWRFFTTYRYYRFLETTTNQVDIGGALPGDTLGTPAARAPRPQVGGYWVAGLTTNINPTTTNTFNFSYLRNFWQWASSGAQPQLGSVPAALEIGGETANSLIPYNVNTQNTRQRFWDGQDKSIRDDITKIKSNHLLTFGGMYERNYDYHLRTDNGGGIMFQPVDQIGPASGTAPGLSGFASYIPSSVPSAQYTTYERLYEEVLGIVTQPQDLYTRSGAQLSLNPPGTPMFDQSVIPSYQFYVTDTWHMKPSFTLNYGLGYSLEMPPYELNGKQVELTDATGHPIELTNYLASRQSAALGGGVYNPELAYTNIKNVQGASNKYPYNPFYGGLAPHASAAWNPHFKDGILGTLFGDGKTVIRGGYGRIYGRLNGVDLVLIPLLGVGLGQPVSCIGASMNGQCLGNGGVTPATAFRIGTDGNVAPLPAISQTLTEPFIPGFNGNAAAGSGSVLDPGFRPSRTDNFTFSMQRELSPKNILEIGYIGRIIRHEWQEVDYDAVPYMTTLGGQSFAQAFSNTYWAVNNTGNAPTPQPFFESALGGANSAFCAGYGSCTNAVVQNFGGQIAGTQVYDLWAAMNRLPSWTLGRTMPSSPINGGSGQVSAIYTDASIGYGNYNALYASLTTRDWHGVTLHSNFTWGRALGTGNQVQASSSYTVMDPWNMHAMYGPQFFDYKFIYSLTMVYSPPVFRSQKGVVGHVLGGWIIAPLFTAHSGAPWNVYSYAGGCQSFGETNCATGGTLDGAVLNGPFTFGNSVHYGLTVPEDAASNPLGVGVNSNPDNGGQGVNLYSNPVAAYNDYRNCVLGFDTNCGSNGNIRGVPFWNLDATISKDIGVWKEGRVGATFIFQITNILNHVNFNNPYLDISDPADFGVMGTSNANGAGEQEGPRNMEFGVRIHF